ncbi:MAG: ABC transporter substrate-binding protein [Pseudomonadota bacterium]
MFSRRMFLGATAALAGLYPQASLFAQTQPIQLGTLYNTSGSLTIFDIPSLHGARLAAHTITAAGGVLGRPLDLVLSEGDSEADGWTTKVPDLMRANPDIVALFGLSDSNNALAAGRASAAEARVFVTSGATSPRLPEEVPTYLFLAPFGDNVQAAAAAEYAYGDLGARNVLVLYDPSRIYTTLLKGYFINRFEGLGGSVIADAQIAPDSSDPSVPEIGGADLVFLSVESADDAARMIPLVRATGFTGPIFGGDGYDAASVWAAHTDISDVYFTTHVCLGADTTNPRVAAFVEAYEEAEPGETPTAFSALAYDTVGLLAAAVENAGAPDPSMMVDGMLAIDGYQGVTGTISYAHGNHIPTKSVTILEVSGGVQSFVTETTPSVVPAP